jgi:hypothetical protein
VPGNLGMERMHCITRLPKLAFVTISLLAVAAARLSYAQSTQKFEVASIKFCKDGLGGQRRWRLISREAEHGVRSSGG